MSGTFGHGGVISDKGEYSQSLKETTERQIKSETPVFSDFFAVSVLHDIFFRNGIDTTLIVMDDELFSKRENKVSIVEYHNQIKEIDAKLESGEYGTGIESYKTYNEDKNKLLNSFKDSFVGYYNQIKEIDAELKSGKYGIGIESYETSNKLKNDLFDILKDKTINRLDNEFSEKILKLSAKQEIVHVPMVNLSKAFDGIYIDANKFFQSLDHTKLPEDLNFEIRRGINRDSSFNLVLDYFKNNGLDVHISNSPDLATDKIKPVYMFLLPDGKDDFGQKQKFIGLLLKTGIVTEEQFKECGFDLQQHYKDIKFGDSFVDKNILKKQILEKGKDYMINLGKSDEISGEIGKF